MATTSRSIARKPAPRKRQSNADQVRGMLASMRLASKQQISEKLGEAGVRAANSLLQKGEFHSPAGGIFTLPTILPDDPRVIELIEATGAKQTSRKVLENRARRSEEQQAKDLISTSRQESLVDQIRRFYRRVDVALLSQLRTQFGPSAAAAVESLCSEGLIRRIDNGVYGKPHIDPTGPEMRALAESNSIEMATIKREIEEAQTQLPQTPIQHDRIKYNVFPTPGSQQPGRRPMRTRLYVNIPNYPAIYAQVGSNRAPAWKPGKDTKLSERAAEMIARMVFDPMPATFHELVQLCTGDNAPQATRRRHGVHDAGDSWRRNFESGDSSYPDDYLGQRHSPQPRQAQHSHSNSVDRYSSYDTNKLDPARLSIPLAEPVTLEIDDREPDWLITRLTGVPNLHILRRNLGVGDYCARFGDSELIFERKTTQDFISSFQSNRLVEQVRKLSERGSPTCFMIEGGLFTHRAFPIAQCASLQTRLAFGMRMQIVETIDMAHTAYAMVTAIREHFFGAQCSKFDVKPRKITGAGPLETAKIMLESISGISSSRAVALLSHFGSLAAIAAASPTGIAAVPGIGQKMAEKIHGALHASSS